MEFDWITVAAQIVNFLVLVWILQRLLYRPVTRAMARRREAIRDRFAEAERRETEAEEEAARLERERADLDARREEILAEAREEAEALRHRLEEEARETVAERRAEWEAQIERERDAFLAELRRKAAGHIARRARRVLDDLAGARLEPAMAEAFLARLKGLDEDDREALRAEAATTGGEMTVTSAHALDEGTRARLREGLQEMLGDAPGLAFAEDPDLVCGIRLRIGGRTLQWSVDAYLEDLDAEVSAALGGGGDRAEAAE